MGAMKDISYERFGIEFITRAVTPERVAGAIRQIAGDAIEVGPMGAGPAGVAQVKATGRLGEAIVTTVPDDLLTFDAVIPIELDLEVLLALARHRYHGEMEISLRLTVRTAEPLILIIHVAELAPADVTISLQAAGMAASVLQRIGDMENEIKKVVARTVNERVHSDEAKAQREIDLLAIIEKAWP